MPGDAIVSGGAGGAIEPSWTGLVEKIRSGDPSGMEELYRVFSGGVRFHLCRQLGAQDLDDKMHDIFVAVAGSIRNGELRDPSRLMGYLWTVVRRQVAASIDANVQTRRKQAGLDSGLAISDQGLDPERRAMARERTEIAARLLNSIPKRDREVLVRFYLREETPAEICRDMGLTETQFRLIKSRAKQRFGELGRSSLSRRRPSPRRVV